MKKVKIALIGCGTVMLKAHIPALMGDPAARISAHLFQIIAVCGLDDEPLEHARALIPSLRVYKDYRKLLDTEDCDAVLIATGETYHPEIASYALHCGKFVLCEKPLGQDTKSLERAFGDLSANARDRMQIAFNKRFHPVFLDYRAAQNNGNFGRPITGMFSFVTQQGRKPGWDGILSNMIHYCDLIVNIFGKPQEIKTICNEFTGGISVSTSIKSTASAVISFMFTSTGSWNGGCNEEWQLTDDARNRIIARNASEFYLIRHDADTIVKESSNSIFWQRDPGGYKTQLSSFYKLVCGTIDKPQVTLDQAIEAHELFDEIRNQCEGSR